jgi:hypothetical protein
VTVPDIVKPCRDVAVKSAVAPTVVIVIARDGGVNENPALLGVTV